MTQIWIALGTNLGDRADNLVTAARLVAGHAAVTGFSHVYESEPWGYTDQPRFLNAVLEGRSELPPLEILRLLKAIEHDMGREPTFRNGPRLIDLDLVAYGDWAFQSSDLTLPHPRMHERLFVLQPLCDLAPDWKHPRYGRTAAQLRDGILKETADSVRRWVEPIEGWKPGPV